MSAEFTPPKSIEVIVKGGTPQAVVEAIAQWLRDADDEDYESEHTCNCGDYNTSTGAPDLDKLADGVLETFGEKR